MGAAAADKLSTAGVDRKPWMKTFGKLRHLYQETVRINRVIENEFGRV